MPGIGELRIHAQSAAPDFISKQINAPFIKIVFTEVTTDDRGFIQYLSAKKGLSTADASSSFKDFCDSLISKRKFSINQVGLFNKNSVGYFDFEAETFPARFSQPVFAGRVIHPEAEHQMLVGDKETTNTAMTEYYTEEPITKSRWWIWAAAIAAIAILAAIIHFSQKGSVGNGTTLF